MLTQNTQQNTTNNLFKSLYLSLFQKSNSYKSILDKQNGATLIIQRWWRQNRWKRFYTIPNEDSENIENSESSHDILVQSGSDNDSNDNTLVGNNFMYFLYNLFKFVINKTFFRKFFYNT